LGQPSPMSWFFWPRSVSTQIPGKLPLRWVLVLPFTLQICVAVGLTGWLSWNSGQRAVDRLAEDRQIEIRDRVVSYLQETLAEPDVLNQLIAEALKQGWLSLERPDALRRYFLEKLRLFESVNAAYLATPAGQVYGVGPFLASGQPQEGMEMSLGNPDLGVSHDALELDGRLGPRLSGISGFDVRQQPWFQATQRTRKPAWSGVYVNSSKQQLAITRAKPLYAPDGSLKLVLAVDIQLSLIDRYLKTLDLGQGGLVLIASQSGTLVGSSIKTPIATVSANKEHNPMPLALATHPLVPQVAGHLQQTFGDVSQIQQTYRTKTQFSDQTYYLKVQPLGNSAAILDMPNWYLVVLLPRQDFAQTVNENLRNTLILCGLAGMVSAITGLLLARWIANPIQQLSQASQRIAQGNLALAYEGVSGIREVDQLSQAVAQMTTQLQAALGRSRSALNESESRFSQIFHSSPDAMCILRLRDGVLVEANQAMLEATGYTAAELVGKKRLALIQDRHQRRQIFDQVRQHRVINHEVSYYTKGGELRTCLLSAEQIQFGEEPYLLFIGRDISDRKQIELQLRQSEATNRALIQAIPDLLIHMHRDGTYLKVVKSDRVALLKPELLMRGSNIYDILPVNLADERMGHIQRALDTGEAQTYEYQIEVNGQIYDEEARIAVLGPDEVLLIIRDIGDRKRPERALRQSKAALQEAQKLAHLGSWSLDPVTEKIHWSEETFRIFGRDPAQGEPSVAELVGLIHPEDRDRHQRVVSRASMLGIPYKLEMRVLQPSGAIRYVAVQSEVRKDSQGRVAQLYGTVMDITQRRFAENQLLASERKYRSLADNLPDGVYRVNTELTLIYLNAAIEKIFGQSRRYLLANNPENFLACIHPEDRDRVQTQLFQKAIGLQSNIELHYRIIHPTRGVRYVRDAVQVIHDHYGAWQGFQGVISDLTTIHQAEQVLREQTRREQSLSRVVQMIRNSLDLETIFNTAVAETGKLLGVDRAIIVKYDSDRQLWVHVAKYRHHPEQITDVTGYVIPDQENPIAAQLKQFQVVQVRDSAALTDSVNQKVAEEFPGSWLLVPLRVGDRLWGSLTLCNLEIAVWENSQVDLVQAVADQLAIAIQQSQLFQQIQRLNADLEQQVRDRTAKLQQAFDFEALLRRISDQVRDSLDEAQILQTAVRELALGLDVSCCDAALYDLEHQTSTIAYEYLQIPHYISGVGKTFQMADLPVIYQQLLDRQCVQFCSMPNSLYSARTWQDTLTTLACPLQDDQTVLGDLWLFRESQTQFSLEEIRLVEQVASQCAIALRQARLYQLAQGQVEELARLNRLKDDFLSTVSHELRTPMANITMAVQMLEIALQKLSLSDLGTTSIPRYLEILKKEGRREIDLINDLLDWSCLDAGSAVFNAQPIDLATWLVNLTLPFRDRVSQQQQHLSVEVAPDIPLVYTDSDNLERILMELLHNACKYTPANERIQLSACVVRGGQANDRASESIAKLGYNPMCAESACVEITVQNTGVSIATTEHDRVFERFYRIPNHDPWKYGGTGLGLALVKKRAEYVNGRVRLESGEDWVAFKVQLPIVLAPAQQNQEH